jgi:protein-S-isoprenylcysteine O-methyltransferase Ste14
MPASSSSGRGLRWVVAQFLVIGMILLLGLVPPAWPDGLQRAGYVLLVVGFACALWAGRTLGASLTPYPRPSERATLVERGPYGIARHPIYLAGLVCMIGYGLLASVPATAAVAVLAVLWHFKAGVEERHLAERFPGYADYRRRVRRGI